MWGPEHAWLFVMPSVHGDYLIGAKVIAMNHCEYRGRCRQTFTSSY